jgi:hypothetical protein
MRRLWHNFYGTPAPMGDDIEQFYYPPPITRKAPLWVGFLAFGLVGTGDDDKLGELLSEIYRAVAGGQYRLAAMGIRALLEQVMIAKVGDLKTFDGKLDAFQTAGYISLLQRDALEATIEIGHAVMHRAFRPSEDDLQKALDIVEGVLAPLFVHKEAGEKLADRVPPRAPRAPK